MDKPIPPTRNGYAIAAFNSESFRDGWYWIDAGSALATVRVEHGVIIEAAPAFNGLIGQHISQILYRTGPID